MKKFTQGTLIAVIGSVALVTTLAGCAGSADDATPTATTTVTTTPTPRVTPTPPGSTATPGAGTGSGTGTGATTDPGVAGTQPRCQTKNLTASVQGQPGGSAAGTQYLQFTVENSGGASCSLQGWPGVSFVGGGNGTQIGAAATEDRLSTHVTVVIPAGSAATIDFTQAEAGNYSAADCAPRTADGYRVYPPGSTTSLFVSAPNTTACSSKSVTQLTTSAVTLGENTGG